MENYSKINGKLLALILAHFGITILMINKIILYNLSAIIENRIRMILNKSLLKKIIFVQMEYMKENFNFKKIKKANLE